MLVTDSFTPDPGTLDSWSVIVTPQVFTCQAVPCAAPDDVLVLDG